MRPRFSERDYAIEAERPLLVVDLPSRFYGEDARIFRMETPCSSFCLIKRLVQQIGQTCDERVSGTSNCCLAYSKRLQRAPTRRNPTH